ncbi:hypothetical protein HAX54_005016, partial [Datura stramonium]|nr:hypothetical protein [Datura stramonium]
MRERRAIGATRPTRRQRTKLAHCRARALPSQACGRVALLRDDGEQNRPLGQRHYDAKWK